MKRLFLFYILTLFLPYLSIAQNNFTVPDRSDKTMWQDFTYDIGNVFMGAGYTYTRPLHWQGDDFLTLGGVAAGTYGLYLVDDNIREELLSHKEDVPQAILDYGWYAGSPQNNYGFTGAVYLTGLFTKNPKLRRTGVLLISSATTTGFLQQLTKSAVGRARPGSDLGKNHFRPFGGSAKYRSFPSGHGVLTFTNAHVIAKQFENIWVKAGIYAIGVVPGISRIYADAHWASDVFLSWATSYFVVEAIDIYLDRKYDEKYNNKKPLQTSFTLTFSGNLIGAVYTF
ncbi:phosphatase PAP2 family protein [Flavobacterium salilacus subsp. salilacus]|uniref:phosphatase PAP2 family protein n=1 Tax=Flavobacterium TaxID=237 RepID=UPI0010756643|nr:MULTISPECIES: phosphatase PAP2 family protein [Flavobacterium]KAF2519174.1 phosphatase PAP2 family protein [Flavobacterium salilacus subsp. salilacus]MBE1613354.1 phosphatase PAP2 family protein [Flavobacterium sp. SaA2.13]